MTDVSFWSSLAVLGLPALLLAMFLPAVLEWKKPKDAGPRLIMGDLSDLSFQVVWFSLVDLEEKQEALLNPAWGSLGLFGFLPYVDG
jgi:hypothetical protein